MEKFDISLFYSLNPGSLRYRWPKCAKSSSVLRNDANRYQMTRAESWFKRLIIKFIKFKKDQTCG